MLRMWDKSDKLDMLDKSDMVDKLDQLDKSDRVYKLDKSGKSNYRSEKLDSRISCAREVSWVSSISCLI